jgi:hypothetical protein
VRLLYEYKCICECHLKEKGKLYISLYIYRHTHTHICMYVCMYITQSLVQFYELKRFDHEFVLATVCFEQWQKYDPDCDTESLILPLCRKLSSW